MSRSNFVKQNSILIFWGAFYRRSSGVRWLALQGRCAHHLLALYRILLITSCSLGIHLYLWSSPRWSTMSFYKNCIMSCSRWVFGCLSWCLIKIVSISQTHQIHVEEGSMLCPNCNHVYPISNGIPNMVHFFLSLQVSTHRSCHYFGLA